MSKKVLIISTSFRPGSNSDTLAHEVERGALATGNEVEFINLSEKNINFCKGCSACQRTFKCVIKDDMNELIEKVRNADVLVFATPIYFYEMSGQLKTFLDRCNPLFPSNYNFRDVYLITTSQVPEDHASDTATTGLLGWITCFEQANLAGIIIGSGVGNKSNGFEDVTSRPDLLEQAYELGRNI